MARYRVNTRFVFSGVFEVEANSRTEARELVMKQQDGSEGTRDERVRFGHGWKHPHHAGR